MSLSTNADADDFRQALGTLDDFNELLGKLRCMHEEVCARNAVLEGRPGHVASQGMPDDPWLPINFRPPMDDPAPRRIPNGIHQVPRNFDVHAIDGVARQQECLCQGMNELRKQQQQLGEQLTTVVSRAHSRRSHTSHRWQQSTLQEDCLTTFKQPSSSMNALSKSLSALVHEAQSTVHEAQSAKQIDIFEPPRSKPEETDTAMPWLSRIVKDQRFEWFFTILIFLNCLVMAFELQYHGTTYGSRTFGFGVSTDMTLAEDLLIIGDWLFGILFCAELIANLLVYRIDFFLHPAVQDDDAEEHKGANFSCTCVNVLSMLFKVFSRIEFWGVLDFLVMFFWVVSVVTSAGLPFDPMVLKLARIAKLLRMLKMVKIVSSFDALYLLVTTIQGSMSALVWSVVLLIVVQAFLSFIMCQQLSVYCQNESRNFEDRQQIWLYFGTYTRSLFTMFEITLGNWVPVGRALMDKTTFKIAATDDQIMIRQKERAARIHKEKMTKLFRRGDKEGTGSLTKEAFAELIVDPALRKWMASMELSIFKEEDVDAVFFLIAGEDGEISPEELVKETSRLKGPARTIDMELRFQELREMITSLERSLQDSVRWKEA